MAGSSTVHAEKPSSDSVWSRTGRALNPMNWTMPKMDLFTRQEPARIKKKDSSVFKSVSRKTSQTWNKTKETLDPRNLIPEQPKTKQSKTEESPSFFSSMFKPQAPEPKQPMTTNEFLAQPRLTH
jgi:hypothetical protein